MKNILVISSSSRVGGNSDLLCDELIKGAMESWCSIRKISLPKLDIAPCLGCWKCKNGKCCLKDGMRDVAACMKAADVIIFATPLYFYSVCGTLKNFWDRTNGWHSAIDGKSTALLIAAADADSDCTATAEACYRGWLNCFKDVRDLGVISATGVFEKGDVLNNKPLIDRVRNFGRSLNTVE